MIKHVFLTRKCIINTTLTPEQVILQLSQSVEQKIRFRVPKPFDFMKPRVYEGQIEDSNFVISEIPRYGDATRPVIKGQVEKTENGARVKLTMQLSLMIRLLAWVLMLLSFSSVCTFIWMWIYQVEKSSNPPYWLGILFSSIMFFIIVGFFLLGFEWNTNSARNDIERIVTAQNRS